MPKSKKKKHKEHEVIVTYKRRKGRPSGINPVVAWHIELDNEFVGTSPTLNGVSHMLYDMGYKTWAFRRTPDKKGRPKFKANVVRFDKEKEL